MKSYHLLSFELASEKKKLQKYKTIKYEILEKL